MRARDAVGKKIVALRQHVVRGKIIGGIGAVADLIEIELEDGTVLRPLVCEVQDGSDYIVELLCRKPQRRVNR